MKTVAQIIHLMMQKVLLILMVTTYPDYLDSCPNQPETFNGIDDADGCPDDKFVFTLDSDQDGI